MNLSFLTGMKTYIVVGALILVSLAEGVMHWDVPGVELGPDWLNNVMMALGLGFLRNGVANAPSK